MPRQDRPCLASSIRISSAASAFEPYRPNFLRRTISRYQLVELFVIIGIILAVWGALSLGKVTSALKQAPSGWLEIRPHRDPRWRLDPERPTDLSPDRLQHAGIGRQRRLRARAQTGGRSHATASTTRRRRRARPSPRPVRLSARHRRNGPMQLWSAMRTLTVGGQDVGTILIAEGLAERYVCGPTSCPPRKSWCSL